MEGQGQVSRGGGARAALLRFIRVVRHERHLRYPSSFSFNGSVALPPAPPTMAKKRKNVDPEAEKPPQWTPPTDDVEWRDWMKHGVWGSDDLCKYGAAHSADASFKTCLPVFSGPDRARLSKNAAKAFDEAVAIFERHMGEACEVSTISDLLTAERKVEYDLNTKKGDYRLFLSAKFLPRREDFKVAFDPVQEFLDPSKFKPIIDFHLQGDAFKAFRAHVSRYPGCDAMQVDLTDEEKKARGVASKTKSTVTHVVISAEACEAFREGREWPMSDEMKAAISFYEARCAQFGVPKGWGSPNGFERIVMDLSRWSGRRPNWLFKPDDPKTGDPDSPSTREEEASFRRYLDGVVESQGSFGDDDARYFG